MPAVQLKFRPTKKAVPELPAKRVRDIMRGPFAVDQTKINMRRLNLSYVLHESSTSPTVASIAKSGWPPRPIPGSRTAAGDVIGIETLERLSPEVILTATIGLPGLLCDIAARLPEVATTVTIDADAACTTELEFFRAPAQLVLPNWSSNRVVAAIAVLRPGGKSAELLCSECFAWPGDASHVIEWLERFILAHVDQWHPRRALWAAPAEELLPEVLKRPESGAIHSR
jgi:hypothetical protein